MNIHFIAGQRVPTPRGHKPSKAGTQPPRTREGLKQGAGHGHNVYPGGKILRKARLKLTERIEGVVSANHKRPDRIATRDEGAALWGQYGFNKPGSMKG